MPMRDFEPLTLTSTNLEEPKLAPTPVNLYRATNWTALAGINFGGWDGQPTLPARLHLQHQIDEDWTPTSHGGHISIYATFLGQRHTAASLCNSAARSQAATSNNNIISYLPRY